LIEAISKLRLGQASPSIFTPVSGVEGFVYPPMAAPKATRACQNRFLSFEIISIKLEFKLQLVLGF
jgi:hypothetical protein